MLTKRVKTNKVYKKYYNNQSRFLIFYGGAGCFKEDQLIETINGAVKIKDLSNNDMVLSMDHKQNKASYKRVIKVHKNQSDKIIHIKMKDGTVIKVTPDHKFYYGGLYVKIKDILLSLQNGDMEKSTKLQQI
jgi:intein/homing endonuclease